MDEGEKTEDGCGEGKGGGDGGEVLSTCDMVHVFEGVPTLL